ncbi:MAG: Ppx/GppA phosphatase family protein [Thermoleophilia bacterium]|nr:Ppx/GppA family phosphatase [Gaiellaceae bacterium]MDW8337815.1 Ppx/GppA phosphatase family protein [Thermoleophilia bacterium]
MAATRVAAVDLGTNSTRLLVADVEDGHVEEVVRRLRITRLGEGVDERRRLLPAPIARVRSCLRDYRRELEALGATRTLAVATSAVRDAENGRAFLDDIESSYGLATRLLDGGEEAELTVRGVASGRAPLAPGTLVVDIGGGSTELVLVTEGGPPRSVSLDVGCVRLTERFLRSDPPTAAQLEAAAEHVRSLLPPLPARAAIGVAGTVTTAATLDEGAAEYDPRRTHGYRLPRASVERELAALAALKNEERLRVPGIEPGRAPVIVGGLVVLREVLDAYGLGEIEVSERDILHGAALLAAELAETEEEAAPRGALTRS